MVWLSLSNGQLQWHASHDFFKDARFENSWGYLMPSQMTPPNQHFSNGFRQGNDDGNTPENGDKNSTDMEQVEVDVTSTTEVTNHVSNGTSANHVNSHVPNGVLQNNVAVPM